MGCKILKRVTWPWPRPFHGRFFIGRLGLAMVNKCTKFKISRFTRNEGMNGGAKCRKWGGLWQLWVTHSGSSAMSPFNRAHTTSYSTLVETVRLSLPFSRYSRLFVESRRFWPNPPSSASSWGMTLVEFRGDLWRQKTRVPGYRVVLFLWSYV